MEVKCKGVAVDLGVAEVRVGTCTDNAGNRYRDLGLGVALDAGIYYLETRENRQVNQVELDAHVDGGLFVAGTTGTLGSGRGYGFGLGGAIGGRILLPLNDSPRAGVRVGGR